MTAIDAMLHGSKTSAESGGGRVADPPAQPEGLAAPFSMVLTQTMIVPPPGTFPPGAHTPLDPSPDADAGGLPPDNAAEDPSLAAHEPEAGTQASVAALLALAAPQPIGMPAAMVQSGNPDGIPPTGLSKALLSAAAAGGAHEQVPEQPPMAVKPAAPAADRAAPAGPSTSIPLHSIAATEWEPATDVAAPPGAAPPAEPADRAAGQVVVSGAVVHASGALVAASDKPSTARSNVWQPARVPASLPPDSRTLGHQPMAAQGPAASATLVPAAVEQSLEEHAPASFGNATWANGPIEPAESAEPLTGGSAAEESTLETSRRGAPGAWRSGDWPRPVAAAPEPVSPAAPAVQGGAPPLAGDHGSAAGVAAARRAVPPERFRPANPGPLAEPATAPAGSLPVPGDLRQAALDDPQPPAAPSVPEQRDSERLGADDQAAPLARRGAQPETAGPVVGVPPGHPRAQETRATSAGLGRWAAEPGNVAYLVEQVVRGVEVAGQATGGWQLQLDPPMLGSLRIEVELGEAGIRARFEAASLATRHLLADNLPQLRDALASQGLQIERLQVELLSAHQQSGGGSTGQFAHFFGEGGGQREPGASQNPAALPASPAAPRGPQRAGRNKDSLDVIV